MITDNRSRNILPFWYNVVSPALTSGGTGQTVLTLQADSDFELFQLMGTCTADLDTDFMPNNFSVQITDQSTGRILMNNRISERQLCSPANGGAILRRGVIFPAQAVLLFDFLDLSGGSNTAQVTLMGYKHFAAQ